MKKLKLSDITVGAAARFKSGSVAHIQTAYTEIIAEIAKAYGAVDPTKYYAINGATIIGVSSSIVRLTAGSIYHNGEIYKVDAVASMANSANYILNIATTYVTAANADPVLFSNGSMNNMHQEDKMTIVPGGVGTGIVDYVELIHLNSVGSGGPAAIVENTGSFHIDDSSTYFIGNGIVYCTLLCERVSTVDFLIGTFTTNYRPSKAYHFTGSATNISDKSIKVVYITVNTNGTITLDGYTNVPGPLDFINVNLIYPTIQ